jgi:hypothetical protein
MGLDLTVITENETKRNHPEQQPGWLPGATLTGDAGMDSADGALL